jgi:hypothetical protein
LQLEPDTDSQPLALAVIVQTGALGASHLRDYRDLGQSWMPLWAACRIASL